MIKHWRTAIFTQAIITFGYNHYSDFAKDLLRANVRYLLGEYTTNQWRAVTAAYGLIISNDTLRDKNTKDAYCLLTISANSELVHELEGEMTKAGMLPDDYDFVSTHIAQLLLEARGPVEATKKLILQGRLIK